CWRTAGVSRLVLAPDPPADAGRPPDENQLPPGGRRGLIRQEFPTFHRPHGCPTEGVATVAAMSASPRPGRPPVPAPGAQSRRTVRRAAVALCLAVLAAAGAFGLYPHVTASYRLHQARQALEQSD